MATVTASSNGQTVTTNYTVPSTAVYPPAPVATVPGLPEVSWASLSPVAGESFGTTLNRLSSPARVVLPAGSFNVIDAAQSGYGFYAPKVLGLRGAGVGQTIIQWVANSITTKVTSPTSAGFFGRIGPNNSSSQSQITLSDLTMQGAPQNGANGLPMNTNAFMNYWGKNFVLNNVKIVGLNYGSGNSPNTGETFAISMYHDVNSVVSNLEVDGRDAGGNYVTASPFGANNSTNLSLVNCYFHDTAYSGLTFSYTSTVSTANATNGVSTWNVKVAHNANHFQATKSGARFTGFNHEQVLGPIRHYAPDIQIDAANLWDAGHMSFLNDLEDNQDMQIWAPVWHESPPWASGAFIVSLDGLQVTPPKVFDANGNPMSPVMVKASSTPATQKLNPATQYICRLPVTPN